MVAPSMKGNPWRGFAAALAAAWLAGCNSSPQMSRIDKNRAIYETWPLEIRQAVLDGRAEPGMTPDMVRVALGEPTEIQNRAGAANPGGEEVWIYRKGGDAIDPMMGTYPGGMGPGYPGYPGSTGGGIIMAPGRGGGVGVIPPSIGIGVPLGAGGIGIGGGGIGIGGINGGMGGGMPVRTTPVEESDVVFHDGVVFRADPPLDNK